MVPSFQFCSWNVLLASFTPCNPWILCIIAFLCFSLNIPPIKDWPVRLQKVFYTRTCVLLMSTQKLAEAVAPNMAASALRNRYKGSKVPDKVALHGLWMLNLLNLPFRHF